MSRFIKDTLFGVTGKERFLLDRTDNGPQPEDPKLIVSQEKTPLTAKEATRGYDR